ncbi:hypothetical protein SAMN05421771_4226 [Granulicella pectinivorans]|jgi:hypothetical protein|uniref:Lipoprotein n=1 Tax=Granulicella pectinivorans TaxID=474950 RepID=A0A1I6N0X5_9BACT|nr:hypothetical protein [Granulicella pectinivorans]SFS21511.1 hypothetical protein SAMN05421771_4226 [Granulicella pectinivorans]
MKTASLTLPSALFAALLLAGCSHPTYYAPPPPPPPAYAVPPLIERAHQEGFRWGTQMGARDISNNLGHHPRQDRVFHDTPGYEPNMGPYEPYRDAFRQAYLDGYERAYYRR